MKKTIQKERWVQSLRYLLAFLGVYLLGTLSARSFTAPGFPFVRNYTSSEYHAHNRNFDVMMDKQGVVYFANFEGLLYYDHAQWRIIHTPGINRLTTVFLDHNQRLWTGGYNYFGYAYADARGQLQLKTVASERQLQGEVVWIWETQKTVYFKMSNGKIYRCIDAKKIVLDPHAQVPTHGASVLQTTEEANQIQQLDDHLQAIATNGNGLIITDDHGREYCRLTEEEGLCSNNVNHITYHEGVLWGATDHGVFAVAIPTVITHFTASEGLKGDVLTLGFQGNTMFAGTLHGVYRRQANRFVPVAGIRHACWQLESTSQGLLAACSDGVYRIDAAGQARLINDNATLSVMSARQGGYYSGEYDGVYLNAPGGSRTKISSLEKVTSMRYNRDGSLRLQNLYGRVFRNDQPTREVANPCYTYTDPQGNLWTTNAEQKQLQVLRNGKRLDKANRLLSGLQDLSIKVVYRTPETIWLGGDFGLICLYPEAHDPFLHRQPQLRLKSVVLNRDSILWGGFDAKTMQSYTLQADEIVTLHWSLDKPHMLGKAMYRYRINGGTWTAWSTQTQDDFINSSYGENRVEIQAMDSFGRLSNSVTYSWYVSYPWYMHWYMLVLYAIALALLIWGFIRWRENRLLQEKQQLETIVRKRTAEIAQQKDEIEEKSHRLEEALDDLGKAQKKLIQQEKIAMVGKLTQGLIDRILNPMNYINNFAKLSISLTQDLQDDVEDEKEQMSEDNYEDAIDVIGMLRENMKKVETHGQNATRTLKTMEEMLQDRTGGMTRIDLSQVVRTHFAQLLVFFQKEIAEHGIQTAISGCDEPIMIQGNPEQLSKTMGNLETNGIYAVIKRQSRLNDAAQSADTVQTDSAYIPELRVTVSHDAEQAYVRIRDNGTGIESTIISKIFDPFFTTKTTGEASGIGLYLSKDIIQNHGGDITVDSVKNEYSEFTITLPLLKE